MYYLWQDSQENQRSRRQNPNTYWDFSLRVNAQIKKANDLEEKLEMKQKARE